MKANINTIMNYMESKNMYPEFYPGIAEFGYNDYPALAGDWWIRKEGNLTCRLLNWIDENKEELNLDALWHDEYMPCSECGKAVRTTADSYGWEPSYVWTCDCEIACHECIEADNKLDDKILIEDVIDYYSNRTDKAVYSWFYEYIETAGFVCYSPDEYCQRFETGFHPGQNDDPKDVAKDIEAELPDYDYIFKIDSVGQFDVYWSVFLRKREG